jgi:hypothetical protein
MVAPAAAHRGLDEVQSQPFNVPVIAGKRAVVVVVVDDADEPAADAPPDTPDDTTCQRFDLLHTYRTPFTVRD